MKLCLSSLLLNDRHKQEFLSNKNVGMSGTISYEY